MVFNGSDQVLLYGLIAGCVGGISSTYPIMPHLFVELYQAYRRKDIKTALLKQRRINEVIRELLKFDTLAAVKQVLKWLDLDCGDPRTPGCPLEEEEAKLLKVNLN